MKKLKILSIILLLAMFITSLCLCTNVQAAGLPGTPATVIIGGGEYIQEEGSGKIISKVGVQLNLRFGGGATIDEVESSEPSVAEVNVETKTIVTKSIGHCKIKLNNGEEENAYNTVDLTIVSDEDYEDVVNIEEAIWGFEIVGANTEYYPNIQQCKVEVGTTASIVYNEGHNLSTYGTVKYEVQNGNYMTVDENGNITMNEVGEGGSILVTLSNEYIKESRAISVNGVASSTEIGGTETEGSGSSDGSTTEGEATEGGSKGESQTESETTETQKPTEERVLDDEPKTGINTLTEVFVSGLAVISLAIVVIAKKK